MKKLVIFDLDGTLVNTVESIQCSVNKTMDEFGMPRLTEEDCKHFVGDGARKLMERCIDFAMKKGIDVTQYKEKICETYDEYFEQYYMYHVVPYDGIRELLGELHKKGILLAVLSNKEHSKAYRVVTNLFGEGTFDEVLGNQLGILRKPSPEGVKKICKKLDVSSKEVLYVGDTSTDMKTGVSAGCFTIGVLWGFREERELRENHADAIIENPNEILSMIN